MPTHNPDLSRLSQTQLADLAGMTPRTVAKRLRVAGVSPVAGDGRTLWFPTVAALWAIFGAPNGSAERAKLDAARAALAEHELARKRGEVIDAKEAVIVWSTQIVAARNRLRALPKRMAVTIPGFTRAMAKAALELIDEALTQLAEDSPRTKRRAKRARRGGVS